MERSGPIDLFYEAPPGAFTEGHVIERWPDMSGAVNDPDSGYWHLNVENDHMMWTDKVYELFGLPVGAPLERAWVLARYSKHSAKTLERIRSLCLEQKVSFILDAEIAPEGSADRWIRVLAVPIVASNRVVGLHGLERAISSKA